MGKKVILAGGSGFLGQALGRRLAAQGWDVVVLTRTPRVGVALREVHWDAETAGAWVAELEGATALVNLAGRSINCVHTRENRRTILESRCRVVTVLGHGWARAKNPPTVWVQCSATGYYGNAGERRCDEAASPGAEFLAEVCRRWEETFQKLDLPGVRRVVLRLGVVLDAQQGALPPLLKLTRRFLGGSAGNGRHYFSWIHRDDLLEVFRAALTQPELAGVANACAPHPVTNSALMKELRRVLGRPWAPPAPAFAIRLAAGPLLGVDPDLALQGQRAVPARLQDAGFRFAHPELAGALRALLRPRGK
ncbi:MAG TPA: TIGR01777 family oxidoreductase [Lacunisphaera sp.]|nr:TIGR01777 family oxidoreductase [Lacunisphaera sp.]